MSGIQSRKTKMERSKGQHMRKKIVIVLLLVLLTIVVFFCFGLVKKEYSIHTIEGTSMEPALTEKYIVLVKKKHQIIRYDMVAFSVDGESGEFVKRVIGLPGDKLFIQNNRMILNVGDVGGFETTYTFQLDPAVSEKYHSLTEIPKDMYFTVGDNLDVSKDSRTFGFVQKKEIEGIIQFHLPAFLKK